MDTIFVVMMFFSMMVVRMRTHRMRIEVCIKKNQGFQFANFWFLFITLTIMNTPAAPQPHPPSIQDVVPFDNYMKKLKASMEVDEFQLN